MPSEPVNMAATSDSMSPNKLHAKSVGELVLEFDVRKLALVQGGHHLVPEHTGLHHIALLGRGDLVAAVARQLEGRPPDPLDFVGVVDLGVDCAPLAVAEIRDLLGLAKVDAAGELAHDHD